MVKIQDIEKLFLYILTYSYLLLPIVFLLLKNKRGNSPKVVAIYGALFFALLFLANPYNSFISRPYLRLFQLFYTFCEYFFFTYLILQNISGRRFKIFIITCSAIFVGFLILEYTAKKSGHLDSIPVGIESILIFVYISFYFYQNFKNSNSDYIYNDPFFWLCIGMLIYLGGTFFFNILVNHVDETQIDKYWFLTYIADIIKNIFFSISLLFFDRFYNREKIASKSVPYLDLDMN